MDLRGLELADDRRDVVGTAAETARRDLRHALAADRGRIGPILFPLERGTSAEKLRLPASRLAGRRFMCELAYPSAPSHMTLSGHHPKMQASEA